MPICPEHDGQTDNPVKSAPFDQWSAICFSGLQPVRFCGRHAASFFFGIS